MGLFSSFFSSSKTETESKEILKEQRKSNFDDFSLIADFIYKESGITDLSSRSLAISQLKTFAKDSEIYTTQEFLESMQKSREFYQGVLNIVTVNETYFFRELSELEWIVDFIKKSSSHINILSLPSSSGEEIYSLLILLQESHIPLSRVSITGYDLNSEVLQKAKEGIYNEHSLHRLPPTLIKEYFTQDEAENYRILDSFREHVELEQKNIFEIREQEKFDLILSRNMFIYFNEQKRKEATQIIVNLLKKEGHFIKGHADNIYKHPDLQNILYGVYKKR